EWRRRFLASPLTTTVEVHSRRPVRSHFVIQLPTLTSLGVPACGELLILGKSVIRHTQGLLGHSRRQPHYSLRLHGQFTILVRCRLFNLNEVGVFFLERAGDLCVDVKRIA